MWRKAARRPDPKAVTPPEYQLDGEEGGRCPLPVRGCVPWVGGEGEQDGRGSAWHTQTSEALGLLPRPAFLRVVASFSAQDH